eukprot:Em0005g629a
MRTVLLKGSDIKRTSRTTVLLKGSDIKRTSRRTALLKGRNTRTIQLPLRHLKGIGIGMTPLSDWLNVLPRGSGIAGVTELPLPPKDAVLPPYHLPPAVAALPPPPPAAELPSPPPAAELPSPPPAAELPSPPPAAELPSPPPAAELPSPPPAAELPSPPPAAELPSPPPAAELPSPSTAAAEAAGAPLQYWYQCPHHHSHGLNQAAEVRDEAWGEEEDKPGEQYIKNSYTYNFNY